MKRKLKHTWRRMISDRKRFGLFCALFLVALLLWARIIVIARPPRMAVAAPDTAATVAEITTSDKLALPVLLETTPWKNPFTVSDKIFPGQQQGDGTLSQSPNNASLQSEREYVEGLQLDAVMAEMAMINGRVHQLGDIVGQQNIADPLRLVEVHGRSVIISSGDRRYELTISFQH